MVWALIYSADGSRLLIHLLVNGFYGLRAILLCGWQRIAHTFACQQLSQWFASRFPLRMAANHLLFRSSMSFTVYASFWAADGSALLIPLLVQGFDNSLGAVLLSGWQWIANSSAC